MDESEPASPAVALRSIGDHIPLEEPSFPLLTKIQQLDREEHIARAMAAGLTREQAESHADDELTHWSPRHIEDRVDQE